jgi:hypothetical protein
VVSAGGQASRTASATCLRRDVLSAWLGPEPGDKLFAGHVHASLLDHPLGKVGPPDHYWRHSLADPSLVEDPVVGLARQPKEMRCTGVHEVQVRVVEPRHGHGAVVDDHLSVGAFAVENEDASRPHRT